MRTTVSVDGDIHEKARRMAFESRRTLSEAINELLAKGLKQAVLPSQRRQLGQLRGKIEMADDRIQAYPISTLPA